MEQHRSHTTQIHQQPCKFYFPRNMRLLYSKSQGNFAKQRQAEILVRNQDQRKQLSHLKPIMIQIIYIYQLIMKQQQITQLYCKNHNKKIIQFGNCLTCSSGAPICEVKGCIKTHTESENVHNVVTIEYLRNILSDYVKSDENKRLYLKKMVHEYFTIAKKELENLFNEVYESVDEFKFDNIILNQSQKRIANNLLNEKYHSVNCSQIAMIIPKLVKCTNFEDGHFVHIRNYLLHQKSKIHSLFYSTILNLPYFRTHGLEDMDNVRFSEISSEWLRQVNQKLMNISYRPKNLRIKYIDVKK